MHVHVKQISTHLVLNSINNLSVFSRPEFKTKKKYEPKDITGHNIYDILEYIIPSIDRSPSGY